MGFFKKKDPGKENEIDKYIDRDLIKKMLDYNQDNLVDIKDITDLSKDIGDSFGKYKDLLRGQIEQVKNDSIKS